MGTESSGFISGEKTSLGGNVFDSVAAVREIQGVGHRCM